MSKRFKGALLSATPPTTTGGTTGAGSAPGVWTLQQEMQAKGSSAWPEATNYIEDVFSTDLYTGNGSTQSINNGIDESGKGALTWLKCRSSASYTHYLFDTARGAGYSLSTPTTGAQANLTGYQSFTSSGFTLSGATDFNLSGQTYASWTFRKQPKFFDVVTYTGTGVARTIAHNLGSVPGCIIVKKTNSTGQWCVYHRGLTSANYGIFLNLTDAQTTDPALWNNTAPTSTVFSLGDSTGVNNAGDTYVAYIFAHDAGGFGLTSTDNVISCGSWTGANTEVNLGWEPQWVLSKRTDSATVGAWEICDNMRGMPAAPGSENYLLANTTAAEVSGGYNFITPTATGFKTSTVSTGTYIYIAIRRGPMKVPTDGTKVFYPSAISNAVDTKNTIGFPTDLVIDKIRGSGTEKMRFFDRLRGLRSPGLSNSVPELVPSDTTAEAANGSENPVVDNTAFYTPSGLTSAYGNIIFWNFRRAPSFMDVVCFTMGSIPSTYTHNLGVKPEFMIAKRRSAVSSWIIYHKDLGATKYLFFPYDSAVQTNNEAWYDTEPTTTQFTVANYSGSSGTTNVWYGFATCPGVSKVGSYTGTGTTKQVDCGFAAGARFVLIKRTDSTGDWYVWDSARGVVAGNDPYLLLNSTAAEVTTTDYIDPYSAGFELSSTAPAAINASGGTYIYLAIA